MMRTAIVLAALALALTAVAVPASADPIYYGCPVNYPKNLDVRLCAIVGPECTTAGGHVGRHLWIEGYCP